MLARSTIFLLALVIANCFAFADDKDRVEAKLIEAKTQFDEAVTKVQTLVVQALEKKAASSKKAGDLKALESIQAQIDDFAKAGKMPQAISTNVYDSQIKLAHTRLEKAFAESIRQYTQDGQIELAKVLQKELDEFKTSNPFIPLATKSEFAPKSVWTDNSGHVLTVIERRGNAFTANFKVGPNIERELTGAIQNDKLSWLAKDVRIVKGGAGGDNYGTIVSDASGHRIDFVWRDERGPSGTFTLRLATTK